MLSADSLCMRVSVCVQYIVCMRYCMSLCVTDCTSVVHSLYAELSEVLWSMVLQLGIGVAVQVGPALGAIAMFVLFAFWAGKHTFK